MPTEMLLGDEKVINGCEIVNNFTNYFGSVGIKNKTIS